MRRNHKLKITFLLTAVALCAGAQGQTSKSEDAPAARSLRALDPSLMDTNTDPCVNFYQYSCGKWLKENPIPADHSSYGRDTELEEENRLVLKAILEKAAAGGESRSANEQKIGDYYATCMDTDAIDHAGLAPFQPMLSHIAELKSKDDLPETLAWLQLNGTGSLFSFYTDQDFKDATQQIAVIDQARLGLPEKGYYTRTDGKSVELRRQYQEHIARTFELLGETHEQAEKDAATVLRLETALAQVSLSNVDRRDPAKVYHKTQLAKLDASTPNFAFDRFLHAVNAPAVESLNVATPEYVTGLNKLLAATDLNDLKTLMRWNAVRRTSSTALPRELDEEGFNFYGKILMGQPEQQARWKRCVEAVDDALGDARRCAGQCAAGGFL